MAALGCGAGQPGTLQAVLYVPPNDTLQFTADAWARPCREGRGYVLDGVNAGNGLLLWMHSGNAVVNGVFPVLARGDTVAPRGVVGGVRFLLHNSDHGVTLDSGAVTISGAPGRVNAQARGSGVDPSTARRVALDASFLALPMAADSVDCRVQVPQ